MKKQNVQTEVKVNAMIPVEEKTRLDMYLVASHKKLVTWIREKISELPEYELKGYPKRKAG